LKLTNSRKSLAIQVLLGLGCGDRGLFLSGFRYGNSYMGKSHWEDVNYNNKLFVSPVYHLVCHSDAFFYCFFHFVTDLCIIKYLHGLPLLPNLSLKISQRNRK
jgi:hypothetical protein